MSDLVVQRNDALAFQAELTEIATLITKKSFDQALDLVKISLAQAPNHSDLINAEGCIYSAMGRHIEAKECFRAALKISPNSAGIWNNFATSLKSQKYFNAAAVCHERADSFDVPNVLAAHNRAICLAEAGRHGEAIAAFTRTLALDPSYHIARWGRARSYLHLGNYNEGWSDYEIRTRTGQLPRRVRPGQQWQGEVYTGKRLVMLVEQGFGDTIWALRYLARVKALGGELVVECQPDLFSLIQSMQVADYVVPAGDPLPDADYHCYHCSLPGLFSRSFDHITGAAYLSAQPWRVRRFKKLFERAKGCLKVGIVWSGSVSFGKNAERALPLKKLLDAVDLPGVQLFSLQKGLPENQLAELNARHTIINLDPYISDFADTAAAISALDLIVMTDSAVAHLAGALGKPVWVLLGHSAHWLWLLDRADTPWYDSMKLFRPRYEDDWNFVIDKVFIDLINMVKI